MGELDNRVAVVTGAARGQGRSHAVALAAEGADIIAIDLCSDIASIPYPLSTKADLDEVDIVVANAGVVAIGRKDPLDENVYRDIVDTNLNGVWHTITATVPSIIRKGRGGSIILISSAQGLVGRGGDGSAASTPTPHRCLPT